MKILSTYEQIEQCISHLDISYSYDLAKKMEQKKTNPVLGYRTAGSHAEHATGDMLYEEMRRLGLSDVSKDEFWLDSWTFEHAILKFTDAQGQEQTCQMGAYQTSFETDGFETYELVYVGRGTAADYEGLDVRGKLVLANINQRDEWWINYPVYQAYLKGAVGLIAVQSQGYGEVDPNALNAQDIAGPEYAPAFSLSQADAKKLMELLKQNYVSDHPSATTASVPTSGMDSSDNRTSTSEKLTDDSVPYTSVTVQLSASSRVERNRPAYNIVGKIPGLYKAEGDDRMILLSAHYDSYFDGFQDDNCAVSMIFGIAKALLESGYHPKHTLVFCALAAEEWGVCDSKYDWSTGAWNQVFRVHPEWQGKVLADLNFELPAHAHNRQDAIRSTYEYADFLKHFADGIQVPEDAYPDGLTVLAPIETWSDDFSMAIAGIPSTVNDFSAGPFMETHYHSQYDNEEIYQAPVYRFHHELYTRLLLTIDELMLPPLDFARLFREMHSAVSDIYAKTEAAGLPAQSDIPALLSAIVPAEDCAYELYDKIMKINHGDFILPPDVTVRLSDRLLHIFRKVQDYFVRLSWQDEVWFPHEAAGRNICHLHQAIQTLEQQDIHGALEALYEVDNNCYAFLFDEEVYYHFTEYILHQPKDRLMWGGGRIMHHENLYGIVRRLKELETQNARHGQTAPLDEEIRRLQAALRRQTAYLADDIHYMIHSVNKIKTLLDGCLRDIQEL